MGVCDWVLVRDDIDGNNDCYYLLNGGYSMIENMNQYLDFTSLKPCNRKEVDRFLQSALSARVGAVCIETGWVYHAKTKLAGSGIKIVTVPNWKRGGGLVNMAGISEGVCKQVDEVDFIWDVSLFGISKDWRSLLKEIEVVRKMTPGVLKIIIETSFIRGMAYKVNLKYESLIKAACKLVNMSGADWIKTDSGLFTRPDFRVMSEGTTLTLDPSAILEEDITLMKKWSKKPIKASAGIRTYEQAEELIKLGAQRIGTSSLQVLVPSPEVRSV